MIVINFKTYKQGKEVISLAKKISKIDKSAILCVQAVDIYSIAKEVKNPVYAQHITPLKSGRNTGFVIPEAIKSVGAKGTLLNHSEHPLTFFEISESVKMCKRLGLKTIVCSSYLSEIKKIILLKPDAIAFEDPSLISTRKSISEYNPKDVLIFSEMMKKTKIIPLCGSGISRKLDIIKAYSLGCKGILISSAIVKKEDFDILK